MPLIRYHHGMSSQTQTSPNPSKPIGVHQSTDFCIVGGGIIGKACALGLAQLGYSVIQIAPNPEKIQVLIPNQYGQRIYALAPSTKTLLSELHVWDVLDHQRIQVVRDMHIFGDRGQANDHLHFSAFEAGRPELAWITEADLIELTLDQAIRFQKQIRNISASVDDIHIEKDAKPTLALDNGEQISAQLIIAADGARSPLRSSIGISVHEHGYDQMAVVANFASSYPHLQTAYQWFLPGGDILAMLPLPTQQVSMVWSTSPENATHLMQLHPEAWSKLLQDQADGSVHKALGTLQLQSIAASFPLKRIKARSLIGPDYDPKVVLLGDAAHVIHPLAGQGLNLGLRDVASLLHVIKNKEEFRAIDDRIILRRYERQREGDTSALLWITHRLKMLFGTNNPLEKQIRNWGLGLVNRSHIIKRQLIERALGE